MEVKAVFYLLVLDFPLEVIRPLSYDLTGESTRPLNCQRCFHLFLPIQDVKNFAVAHQPVPQ